jgi:hypothetical protein
MKKNKMQEYTTTILTEVRSTIIEKKQFGNDKNYNGKCRKKQHKSPK